MGLFDRILKTGARAAERAISRAVNDAVYETVHETVDKTLRNGIDKTKETIASTVTSGRDSSASTKTSSVSANTSSYVSDKEEEDDRLFAQKLPDVLNRIGEFEIRKNISPDVIEQEAGRELYKRNRCYRLPKDISYAIYKDGERVLFINIWQSYEEYKHKANRQIKEYCDRNNTPMLDFFEYMPNHISYMEDRIRKAIG